MASLGGSEGNFDLHANFTAKLLEENVSLIFKLFYFLPFSFLRVEIYVCVWQGGLKSLI